MIVVSSEGAERIIGTSNESVLKRGRLRAGETGREEERCWNVAFCKGSSVDFVIMVNKG